jgi:ATP-dependent RNA helicase DDX49/DBP8
VYSLRGLDIPAVEVVVNVNVPAAPKDYLHRVGRTARAGRGGLSVTMVTQYDVLRLKNIESYTKVTMGEYPIAESDVLKILNPVSVARRQMDLALSERSFGEARRLNKRKRLIADGKSLVKGKRRRLKKDKKQ